MDDIYNYSNKDKIIMIYNDLEKYMKHLKRDLGSIKQSLKTISAYQTDSHKTLMRFLKQKYLNNNTNNDNDNDNTIDE